MYIYRHGYYIQSFAQKCKCWILYLHTYPRAHATHAIGKHVYHVRLFAAYSSMNCRIAASVHIGQREVNILQDTWHTPLERHKMSLGWSGNVRIVWFKHGLTVWLGTTVQHAPNQPEEPLAFSWRQHSHHVKWRPKFEHICLWLTFDDLMMSM